jgi:limonene-1,2-epoxide hydrolase
MATLLAGIDQIELKILNMGVVDDVVFLERADDFTFNGRHGVVPVVGVMEIENGKVKMWREYYDHSVLRSCHPRRCSGSRTKTGGGGWRQCHRCSAQPG